MDVDDPCDCVEVGVDMQDREAPRLGGCGDKKVDDRWTAMLAELDERVLRPFNEPPSVIGHRMPCEQGPQYRAEPVAVGAAGRGSDQLGFDGRTDTDNARSDGVKPPRDDAFTMTKAYDDGRVSEKGHAAPPA